MLSEKSLRHELKRLPKLIKDRLKEGSRDSIFEALEMTHITDCLEWVLSDED